MIDSIDAGQEFFVAVSLLLQPFPRLSKKKLSCVTLLAQSFLIYQTSQLTRIFDVSRDGAGGAPGKALVQRDGLGKGGLGKKGLTAVSALPPAGSLQCRRKFF